MKAVKNGVRFQKDIEGMTLMAAFIAELTYKGIMFETEEHDNYYDVIMTGGF